MQRILLIFLSFLSFSSVNFLCAIEKLVVIGKGPVGCSAAIFSAQAQLSPFVVEGQECDGQLMIVNHIENYPGFPDGINGEELVQRMRLQAERFGTHFKNNYVVEANFLTHPFQLTLDNGEIIHSISVIIATGASPRWLGVPHEEALKGRGGKCECYL
jgi:thioredoxin reductase (NADPH)